MPPSTKNPPILVPPPLHPPNPSILLAPPSHLSGLALGPLPSPALQPPYNLPTLFLQALSVRIPVFVHEQGCSLEGEIDEDDARSWHFVAFAEGPRACATLRVVPPGDAGYGDGKEGEKDGKRQEEATEPYHGATDMWDGREKYIKIGRMATLKEDRGQGVAAGLLDEALRWVGVHRAESEVKGWWRKMGFVEDEGLGRWWEEGIEHVGMWRRLGDDEGVGYVDGGNDAYRRLKEELEEQ
ncbi:MAG: hypothetical protein Q9184_007353 [Pyrenodesmia sp. 2 TL-2023]